MTDEAAPIPPQHPPESFLTLQQDNARRWRLAGKSADEIRTGLKDVAEKCGMGWDDAWMPYGGAMSFADIDQYETAAAAEGEVYELTYKFQSIVDNIFGTDDLTLDQKSSRIIQASRDLRRRIGVEVDAAVADAQQHTIATIETGSAERHERPSGFVNRLKGLTGRGPTSQITPPPPAASVNSTADATGKPQEAGFRAFKDALGDWRWVAIWSNTFKDRQDERFTEDAHREYIDYVDREKAYPELWPWHMPHRLGAADMVDLTSEGFTIATGTFDPGQETAAKSLGEMGALGVSHGYEYPKSALVDGVYHNYRTFEISALPWEAAANQYTGFLAGEVFNMPLTPEKKAFAERVLGADMVAGLEDQLARARTKADDAGVSFKDVLEAIAPEPAPVAAKAAGLDELKDIITAALSPVQTAIDALASRQGALDVQVKALAASDDEKIAAKMAPRGQPQAFIASTAPESVARMNASDVKDAAAGLAVEGTVFEGAPAHLKEYIADIFKQPQPV